VVFEKSDFSGLGTAPTSEDGAARDRSSRSATKSVMVENVNMMDKYFVQRYGLVKDCLNGMIEDMSVYLHWYRDCSNDK